MSGQVLVISYDGYKYYVIFVDHFTCYIWLYNLKQKSDVHYIFILFKAFVEKHFKFSIFTLYKDNREEYISWKSFVAINGISHLTIPPNTLEHNGLSNIIIAA